MTKPTGCLSDAAFSAGKFCEYPSPLFIGLVNRAAGLAYPITEFDSDPWISTANG